MTKQIDQAARLTEWLKANKVSLARLCADIEIHPLTPYQWRRGKRPTLAVAVKIEKYTEGAVPCGSWIAEVGS
jgi:hypothetical protein